LRKAFLLERGKISPKIEDDFWNCVNILQLLPYYIHSRPIKEKLINSSSIVVDKNSEVNIKDLVKTIEVIKEYLRKENITTVESLNPEVKHIGWYYEI